MELDGGGAQSGRGGAGQARSRLGDGHGSRVRTTGLDGEAPVNGERRTGATASSGGEESVRERASGGIEGELGAFMEREGRGEGVGEERPAVNGHQWRPLTPMSERDCGGGREEMAVSVSGLRGGGRAGTPRGRARRGWARSRSGPGAGARRGAGALGGGMTREERGREALMGRSHRSVRERGEWGRG